MNLKAIGMFDSGIGGLTVYRAIKRLLPNEKIVYLGDTARLPYGSKSAETIVRFSDENTRFLLKKNVKIIVVACNSSSSYALTHLQNNFAIPIVGVIEPGVEAALQVSRRRIGVIGTTATIMSGAYRNAIVQRSPETEVVSRDCPLFVPLVEEGWISHPVTRQVIEEYLLPLKQQGIEALVLGCTHYPVLKEVIAAVLGPTIPLIDSAETTAARVGSVLRTLDWQNNSGQAQEDEFYVTDFVERFKKVGAIFLNHAIEKVEVSQI